MRPRQQPTYQLKSHEFAEHTQTQKRYLRCEKSGYVSIPFTT